MKRPLVVETSLPRFLAPTDSAELTVQLFNESGTEQTVRERATAGGAAIAVQTSVVLAGRIEARIDDDSRAERSGGHRHAITWIQAVSFTDDIEVPVRPTAPRRRSRSGVH
ncbi:MAG: hypothetical protein M9935_06410 [Kiritimatiellae bacterium]|nr:hypothetical protein [Kiritimatiellia bacterium]